MREWDLEIPAIRPGGFLYKSLEESFLIHPYKIVEDFERALCAYTGSPFAIAVSSCSIAIEMICRLLHVGEVTIPRRTYASVPQGIVKSGGRVLFGDITWRGAYQLSPSPIWDCAPRFTQGMYKAGQYQCLSFHRRKILGHSEGGAILLENAEYANLLRVMRHDGRPAGFSMPIMIGYHAVMSPGIAAELLAKADIWDRPHEDMPCDNYPDLSLVDWNTLSGGSDDPLYRLRDANNRLFVKAWRRLQELDPVMWKEYQQGISDNDRSITELMQCDG